MDLRKKATIVLCLILMAVLAGLFYMQRRQEQEEKENLTGLNHEIQQLQMEKSNLEKELRTLTRKNAGQESEQPTGVLCFTSIDQDIFSQAYSNVQKEGYTGIFILRNGRLPGDYNTITVEQCVELLDSGWEYGIAWDQDEDSKTQWEEDVVGYLENLRNRIGVLPSVYYFEEGMYDAAVAEVLPDHGISVILYEDSEQIEDVDGITYIPVRGYLDDFSELDADSLLALNVQIAWNTDTKSSVRYRADDLSDVLAQTDVLISDISHIQSLIQQKKELKEQISLQEKEIRQIQDMISEIDQKIKEKYR
ncbi:MAG: hypothetical protein ACI4D3_09595 [Lachnospiraceae bacterium]